MTPLTLVRFASLGAFAALVAACVVETTDRGYGGGGPVATAPPDPSASTSTPTSDTPILVVIDTGKTMNAAPGGGVGVFTEYVAGGHWHVWWTCDSLVPKSTHQSCAFDVRIRAESGVPSRVKPEQLAGSDSVVNDDAQTLHATTVTSAGSSGLTFDTDPGAVVRVTATMDGLTDGSFFLFVQKGIVNGGYQGKLTNPLLFQASRP